MVFPPFLYDEVMKVQDTTVICPSRASQRVALHCMRDHPGHLREYIGKLDKSRRYLIRWLEGRRDLLRCPSPDGAYYALPEMVGTGVVGDSFTLVRDILDRTNVLLVPGTPFGADQTPHFRISYGNLEPSMFEEAIETLDGYFLL